jgi:putative membrane protein insertion efficiency factor
MLAFVRAYRAVLKPVLPAACRFDPSCSTYALEAIRVHGAWRGGALAVKRLLRCRPWGGFGHDPVPAKRNRTV